MAYNVNAAVNYPEQSDVKTPDYARLTEKGVIDFVQQLLASEPDATSFMIVITPVK